MLDIVLFRAWTEYAAGLEMLGEKLRAGAFLVKVYCDFKSTIVEVNIWRAFVAIGFTYDIDQILYGLLFDEEKFQQSPGFLGLWERSVPLGSLSKGRRESKFRSIHKPE
jgi:hypothetical protein